MKRRLSILLLIPLILLFTDCSKDPLPSLRAGEDLQGKLCRVIRFQEGNFIGYLNYLYNEEGQNSQLELISSNGIKTSRSYHYGINGKINKEIHFNQYSDPVKTIYYFYDIRDSLEKIQESDGNTLETQRVFSTAGILSQERFLIDNELESYTNYLYDSENELWKSAHYQPDTGLVSYDLHYSFSNGIKRIDTYSANNILQHVKILRSNTSGQLIEVIDQDADGKTLGRIISEYSAAKIFNRKSYNSDNEVLSEEHFQYFQ